MGKAAGLNPETFLQGGGVSDGDYTIREARADLFTYPGTSTTSPALMVVFHDGTSDIEQAYTAGKAEHLMPSDDKRSFVHPGGGDAAIGKQSNAAAFLTSLVKSGFPVALLGEDVSAIQGTRVTITNVAQPKRPGIKDEKEGKTISLVTKVLELPKGKGKAATAAKTVAAATAAKTVAAATSTQTAATSNGDGDLDEAARAQVLTVLATTPGGSMSRLKLGTSVMLACANDPQLKPLMLELRKRAQDATWLASHAEAGGWLVSGDVVGIAQ